MYLLTLLLLLVPTWFLLSHTVFCWDFPALSRLVRRWRRSPSASSADHRTAETFPLVIAAVLLAAAGILDEVLLPGSFRWLTFVPPSVSDLGRATLCQHALALLPVIAMLVSRRRQLGSGEIALALALWVVTNAALVALLQINTRIDYPFDLEWMEGTMVDHAVMLRRGSALYQEPSPHYIPYLYGPLYHRIVGLLPYVERSPYLPGRMVSLAATGVSVLLVFGIVARRARDGWLGLLVAMCLPASYSFVGYWFDIHRVDPTFICLTLLGTAVAVSAPRPGRARLAAAGLCFALAVFAKQAAGLIAVAVGLLIWLNQGWRSALTIGAAGLAGGALLLGLEMAGSGPALFFRYVVTLPTKIRQPSWLYFRNEVVNSDLIALPGLVWLFFLVDGVLGHARSAGWRGLYREPTFLVSAMLIGVTVAMRVKPGGFLNCRLPLVVGGILALGLWLSEHRSDWARLWTAALLLTAYASFMDPLMEHGKGVIPSSKDLSAQRQLEDYLRQRPGAVLSIFHTHLSYSSKRQLSFHDLAVRDWTMAFGYPRAIVEAMQERRWSTIVTDVTELRLGPAEAQRAFNDGYRCQKNRFGWDAETGFTVVGYRTRPEFVCERRGEP